MSASAGVTDVAIPPGSLLAWSHALSDSFTETQRRFARRIKDGKACHTLLPTLNRFERVSNSPTQGKELRANPDVLDLLRDKVPDSRHVPLSLKEAAALERSLRSVLESHNFLTWSVVALIRSLHDKNLLPKDNQIISQLQKSFSKACGNVASGLSSSAAFVTLKRRQLLLSHVVPSVSDAQKRNLLSDPFFQTGSLFSSSSVEAARSAARDLSLFKPHLTALPSATPSRRSGYSGSEAPRAPSRPSSPHSSSVRSSSPHRPQSGKKDDSRFQKKSSGPPPEAGGFSEVGALFLIGDRRLPSQLLVGLEGSGFGRLGSGGPSGRLSDPLQPSISSIRTPTLPAFVLPTIHHGSRLDPGAAINSKGAVEPAPQSPGVYSRRFRQPSQVWGQDASLPGRLSHPGLFGASRKDLLRQPHFLRFHQLAA